MMDRLVLWFCAVALAVGAILLYLRSLPVPEGVGTTTEARQASELREELTIPLDVEFVKVFEPEVKTRLKLPKTVIDDPDKHVVSSSKIKADEHPHTVTTVLDKSTGELTTYDRKDPLPWLAVTNRTHIGAYYGLKNGQEAVRIQAQQELLQIKSLRIEAVASVDIGSGKPDTFIGIGGRVSF